jgi:hypothetical protein
VDIVELEHALDETLPRPAAVGGVSGGVQGAATRWSEAVWNRAVSGGPLDLTSSERSRGLQLALHPVFVCGVHRSGTTLVRDLLDGHPALLVLPSEGTFFTNLEPSLRQLPQDQWLSFVGCEWLRRMANPIYQIPYWVLGRSSPTASPYVDFARSLLAWWSIIKDQFSGSVRAWPLLSVVLAYAHSTRALSQSSGVRFWVEKTPTNEQFLKELYSDFPTAKVVHVVRHPYSVYASQKRLYEIAAEPFDIRFTVMRDLSFSFQIAVSETSVRSSHSYLVLKYEQLATANEYETAALASFLDIEPHLSLTRTTVADQLSMSNSAFSQEGSAIGRVSRASSIGNHTLTSFERECITASLGDAPLQFGYRLDPVSIVRRMLLRTSLLINEQARRFRRSLSYI